MFSVLPFKNYKTYVLYNQCNFNQKLENDRNKTDAKPCLVNKSFKEKNDKTARKAVRTFDYKLNNLLSDENT